MFLKEEMLIKYKNMCSIKYQSKLNILLCNKIINKNKFSDESNDIQKKNKMDCISVKGTEFSKNECDEKSKFL